MSAQPSDSLPDAETIKKASVLSVDDDKGESIQFGALINDQKTIVVFIRMHQPREFIMQDF